MWLYVFLAWCSIRVYMGRRLYKVLIRCLSYRSFMVVHQVNVLFVKFYESLTFLDVVFRWARSPCH